MVGWLGQLGQLLGPRFSGRLHLGDRLLGVSVLIFWFGLDLFLAFTVHLILIDRFSPTVICRLVLDIIHLDLDLSGGALENSLDTLNQVHSLLIVFSDGEALQLRLLVIILD